MARELSFREMTTSPKDGTPIEVRHGPIQEIALAFWSEQNPAWISANNPPPKTLQSVRVWRPAPLLWTPRNVAAPGTIKSTIRNDPGRRRALAGPRYDKIMKWQFCCLTLTRATSTVVPTYPLSHSDKDTYKKLTNIRGETPITSKQLLYFGATKPSRAEMTYKGSI